MLGGLLGAAMAGALIWYPLSLMTVNLPGMTGTVGRDVPFGFALLIGFLAGAAVSSRARRGREHLGLFTTVTGAVAGSAISAVTALVIATAYVHVYGQIPNDLLDRGLAALAIASWTGLALFLGAAGGAILGALIGLPLKLARRQHSSEPEPQLRSRLERV